MWSAVFTTALAPRAGSTSLQTFPPGVDGERVWLCTSVDIHELKARQQAIEHRAALQADMLNISVDCIKLIALDGTLVHMNKAGCQALGVPEDSAFGMPWMSLLPSDLWTECERALEKVRAGESARFAGRSVVPGSHVRHWDNMLTPVFGDDGRVRSILCVSRDVTAEYAAVAALRGSQERLALAARVGGLGVWDYDLQRDRLHCDDAWYAIMGRDPSRPVRALDEFKPFIHPDDADRATEVRHTAEGLLAANSDYAITFRIVRPNGDIRWVRSAACLIRDAEGRASRAVGFVVDITDAWRGELALRAANLALEAERESLARQSLEDPLTGIPNRRHFDTELLGVCLRAHETGEPVVIGMIDVDCFKAFNDRYGHPAGDAALRRIAMALKSMARPYDIVARHGGEEFVFVLPGVVDPGPIVERFAAAVADLRIHHEDSPTRRLTISCGCVVAEEVANLTPAWLLQASDNALYEAKAGGGNHHVIRRIGPMPTSAGKSQPS